MLRRLAKARRSASHKPQRQIKPAIPLKQDQNHGVESMSVEIVLAWVLVAVLLAYGIAGRIREWLRFRHADRWPVSPVVSIGEISVESNGDEFQLETVCLFKVDGRIYTTTMKESFGSRRMAEQFAGSLAADLPLQVRFNPGDPDIARVELAASRESEGRSSIAARKAG